MNTTVVEADLCEHLGCLAGGAPAPVPLFPGVAGSPVRLGIWGGWGPGDARSGVDCPSGSADRCCGCCEMD
jgi:hypothetical protein